MGGYRIEVRDGGRWLEAPGESAGCTLEGARRAVSGPMYGLDGSPIDPADVRIVDEQTGAVVASHQEA